ncbi:MAG: caspase family protein [Planctomycetia bacterium]|nr:caspase family protein [Planctomycetia bacterium]
MNRAGIISIIFYSLMLVFIVRPVLSEEEQPAGRNYAVVIAVSEYDSNEMNLPLVKNDGPAIAVTLQDLGKYKVYALYDSQQESCRPTRDNIIKTVTNVAGRCQEGDTLLVYFSGHGWAENGNSYLLPRDAGDTIETYIPAQDIRNLMHESKATCKFFLIDACQAGGEDTTARGSDSSENEPGWSFKSFINSIEQLEETKSFPPIAKDEVPSDSTSDENSNDTSNVDSAEVETKTDSENTGVFTLASCKKTEKSYFYESKKMSVFTYWLNEGLRGHADYSDDGNVDTSELFKYVNASVVKIKDAQTPVMIHGSDIPEAWSMITPRPVSLNRLLENMADRVETAMSMNSCSKTGVVTFEVFNEGGYRMKENIVAPVDFARKLDNKLEKTLTDCQVTNFDSLQKKLESAGITPETLYNSEKYTPEVLATLPDSFVIGQITKKKNGAWLVECKLFDPKTQENIHTMKGTTTLSASEEAVNQGTSVTNEALTQSNTASSASNNATTAPSQNLTTTATQADQVTVAQSRLEQNPAPEDLGRETTDANYSYTFYQRLEAAADSTHPLLLPAESRHFDTWIEVLDPVTGRYHAVDFWRFDSEPNNLYVPLEPGDVYQVRVRNRCSETMGLRLLVDGLGTLPERPVVKSKMRIAGPLDSTENTRTTDTEVANNESVANTGQLENSNETAANTENSNAQSNVEPTGADSAPTMPLVDVDMMKAWYLQPFTPTQPATDYVIKGFYTFIPQDPMASSVFYDFTVVEAPDSLATQKGYTDQLGIISCIFYETVEGMRGPNDALGTIPGQRRVERLARTSARVPEGQTPFEIITIRYARLSSLQSRADGQIISSSTVHP